MKQKAKSKVIDTISEIARTGAESITLLPKQYELVESLLVQRDGGMYYADIRVVKHGED